MLHNTDGYAHFYLQSIFMNNEISKTRKPTIVGRSKISLNAYIKLSESLQQASQGINQEYCDIILLNPNNELNTFEIIVIPRLYENKYMTFSAILNVVPCKSSFALSMKNDLFTAPTSIQSIQTLSSLKKAGIFYFPQEADLTFTKAHSLETKPTN